MKQLNRSCSLSPPGVMVLRVWIQMASRSSNSLWVLPLLIFGWILSIAMNMRSLIIPFWHIHKWLARGMSCLWCISPKSSPIHLRKCRIVFPTYFFAAFACSFIYHKGGLTVLELCYVIFTVGLIGCKAGACLYISTRDTATAAVAATCLTGQPVVRTGGSFEVTFDQFFSNALSLTIGNLGSRSYQFF